jgi:predicted flap endonuclease-1-like 5' DNA nuclease
LTAIRGIGIAAQNRLYRAAIKSYAQLAGASPEQVQAILGKLARGADVEDWIAQAQDLASKEES